jgi:hypothetical protein
MMRTSTPAWRRSRRIAVIFGGELVLLPDEVLQVDEALRLRHVLEQVRELGATVVEELDGRRGQHACDVLGRDGTRDGLRHLHSPLLVEAGRGAGVAFVDGLHLLHLDVVQALVPALALRDDLPVAAEEDVEDESDDRREEQDEEPRQRGGGFAVVHDQQDHDEHPVDENDEIDAARQQLHQRRHGCTLLDEAERVI